MKILVIAGRYGISGVPLAQLRFANSLAKHFKKVELAYGYKPSNIELPKTQNISIRVFNKKRVSFLLFDLIKYFRIEKPDIVFSAGDHLNVVVLMAAIISFFSGKISCSSRVTPYDTYSNKLFSKGWLLKIAMKLLSTRANALTCVSKDMVKQYKEIFGKQSTHKYSYNIVFSDHTESLFNEENIEYEVFTKKKFIVAAGNLEPWKGFHELIEAFNIIKNDVPLNLLILGEGSLRSNLSKQIKQCDLEERIFLIGNVNNPFYFFSKAEAFILSSKVEGMPNVLIEAMYAGCTPVSYDCETGPREIIQDKFGYLVETGNIKQLSETIIKALNHPIPSSQLKLATQEFSENNVLTRQFNLIGIDYEF